MSRDQFLMVSVSVLRVLVSVWSRCFWSRSQGALTSDGHRSVVYVTFSYLLIFFSPSLFQSPQQLVGSLNMQCLHTLLSFFVHRC